MHVIDGAAFAGDAGAAEVGVEVLDVEGEDLLCSGGGFVEHPPQQPFSQGVAKVGEQRFQPGLRDGAVLAPGGFAALQAAGWVGGQDVLALGPGGEGDQR
ncbi:hypothetical protein [Nonomuraea sp. NPDC005501]|uniref:hypothetical protein n=1 Tax=Nonomuraea sp. NPDC005501 TaxID=3156884 RepID=UPI0033B17C6D